MPAEVIMDITTQKDYKVFKRYFKIVNEHKKDEMNKIFNPGPTVQYDAMTERMHKEETEKRIKELEGMVEKLSVVHNFKEKKAESTAQGSTRQTTLAFYYMQKAQSFPRKTGSNKTDAEFMQFLTGKNSDEIRKLLGNPLKRQIEKTGKATKKLITDLNKVLNMFELIEFSKGIELIKNEIALLEKDLETFTE
jgi:hypothetical protein